MSVEADLHALLSPLVGGRVFPDLSPSGTARPYVTYQQIGGQVINPLTNDVPNKQNGLFQVDVWADRRIEAASLALQIEAAMRTATAFVARPVAAPMARHEDDPKLFGSMQDFSIWSDR